ncbi:MAG: hypothetical protein F6K53_34120 [Moorea sp. SIO4A1]|uniref:TRAFAC clade GTPase domain-containing protein n=1 Tax=Moorena sp. SIO4A1 TaxID=2607835 RepID=UPI00144E3295|nr:hypothetical protein [Moorena sp. SIO4A1]NEQ62173.1 hypothetical protein [Moorena sp. SIO4A1]
MLDKWLGKNKLGKKILPKPAQLSASVRVIGDRKSGKTTYMAALARWPGADPSTSPVQTVTPINEDGEALIAKAKNLLEQGEQLEGTPLDANVDEVKDYSIEIVLKDQCSWQRLKRLNINCKDYSGEFFQDVLYQSGTPLLRDYLEDAVQANGIMLLLDGLAHRKDREYANGLDKFLIALDRAETGVIHRRIALVLTKCEQPELWVNRHQPKYVANARFPEVMKRLQAWEQSGPGSIDCFTTSAFGMLGERHPEPNMRRISRDREGIKESILKNPQGWKPFGLVAPIYWLCTGQRHRKLDQE